MKTGVSSVLTRLMKEKNITSAELSRLTGVVQPVIYRIASGDTENPKIETLIPIANYFGITIDALVGLKLEQKNNQSHNTHAESQLSTPLLDWNQISLWPQIKKEEIKANLIYQRPDAHPSFGIKLSDSSLEPRFSRGTILIFESNPNPKNLDFILTRFIGHEQISLKQLILDGNDQYLKSINPELRMIFVEKKESCEIFGVLTEAIINLRS